MIWETIRPILIGAGTGLFASFVGYIKNMPKGETIKWRKMTPAVTMGTIVGIYAAYAGIDMASSASVMGGSGVVLIVNYLWSAIWKFIDNKKSTGKFISK